MASLPISLPPITGLPAIGSKSLTRQKIRFSDPAKVRDELSNMPAPNFLLTAPYPLQRVGMSLALNAHLSNLPLEQFIPKLLLSPRSFLLIEEWDDGADGGVFVTPVPFIPGHRQNGMYGPTPCKVAVIGKMPWKDEVRANRNLVGEAGRVLRQMCADVGLSLERWYLTNVCHYQPAQERKVLPRDVVRDGVPLLYYELSIVKPEFILCLGTDAVRALFETGGAETLRGVPHTWHGPGGITSQVVSTLIPSQVAQNSGLRAGFVADLRLLAETIDPTRHREESMTVDYRVIDTEERLDAFVDEMLRDNRLELCVDCEWFGNDPRGVAPKHMLRTIQIGWDVGCAALIVCSDMRRNQVLLQRGKFWLANKLRPLFDRRGARYIGHSIRADWPWLDDLGLTGSYMEDAIANGFDTMLAHHILDENAPHGLHDLAPVYTNLGAYDAALRTYLKQNGGTTDRLEEDGYGWLPDEILYPYALKDVDAPHQLMRAFMPMLEKAHHEDMLANVPLRWDGQPATLKMLFERVVQPVTVPIFHLEKEGFAVDEARLSHLAETYSRCADMILDALRLKLSWPEFNPDSIDHMRMLLFSGQEFKNKKPHVAPPGARLMNLPPVKATGKNGKTWDRVTPSESLPSADKDVLSILALHHKHEPLRLLREYRSVYQVCKAFLRMPDDETGEIDGGLLSFVQNGRIHTHLTQLIETGRYGSFKPNLQNIVSGREASLQATVKRWTGLEIPSIRSAFVAPPGWVLVEADYKSAELVVMAWYSKERKMMQALRDPNRDLHLETANETFHLGLQLSGISPDELEKLKKKYKSQRVRGKGVNFGVPYGLQAAGLALRMQAEGVEDANVAECESLLDAHSVIYPRLHGFLEFVASTVVSPGFFRNVCGRRRRFTPSTDRFIISQQEREARNFPIQGTVAETLSEALVRFWRYAREHGENRFRVVLPVHDALIFMVRPYFVREFITDVLPSCMRIPIPGLDVTLEIDSAVGLRWSESATAEQLLEAGMSEADIHEFA